MLISEADKFDEVKNATAAIGLANIDTKDVIAGFWYGTDFFRTWRIHCHLCIYFSQCIKYNDQYKDKNRIMEGMYSAFNITTKGDQLELSVYHIIKAIRLPLLKKLQDLQDQDLDIGIRKPDLHSDFFLTFYSKKRQ